MEIFVIVAVVGLSSLAFGGFSLAWWLHFKPIKRRRYEKQHHRKKAQADPMGS